MTVSISNLNFTWANSSNVFTAIGANVNASSYNINSRVIRFTVNSNTVFSVDALGNMTSKNLTADIVTANSITIINPATSLTLNTLNSNTITGNVISSNTVITNIVTSNIITTNTVTSNTVNAAIYYDSGNTNFYLDPASTSNLYSANFERTLFVPRYTLYFDATNASRTTPNTFTKSYTASHVSFGSLLGLKFEGFSAGGSYLFEMNVKCTSATTVTSYIHFVDDNAYFFLNGGLISSVTGSGGKNTSISWSLLQGLNTIQIVLNNSGGSTSSISYLADYFQNGNTAFISP